MVVCKQARYSGRVQGVGFRYATQRLAEGFAVAGYVRNLPSGEVELLAEGEEDEVQGFLDAIARQMLDYIEEQTVRDQAACGFTGFTIRH